MTEARVEILAIAAAIALVFRVILHDAVRLPVGHLDDLPRIARISLQS